MDRMETLAGHKMTPDRSRRRAMAPMAETANHETTSVNLLFLFVHVPLLALGHTT